VVALINQNQHPGKTAIEKKNVQKTMIAIVES
jgi:hypothetical protein